MSPSSEVVELENLIYDKQSQPNLKELLKSKLSHIFGGGLRLREKEIMAPDTGSPEKSQQRAPYTSIPKSSIYPDEHGQFADPKVHSVKDYTRWGIPFPSVESPAYNGMERVRQCLYKLVDAPVRFVRERIVLPMQAKNKPHVYYHRKFARVPNIDECEEGDLGCYYEANEQYKRDKEVDGEIVNILRKRKDECVQYEREDWAKNCAEAMEEYEHNYTNFFIRYGELGHFTSVVDAYMKQKHRLIWERRNPDKVDFMYAKERQAVGKYIFPVKPGFMDSPTVPDNSRAVLHRTVAPGTGGTLVHDPDSPQDASKHFGKKYNQKDYQGKFES
ncbi:putative NADH dehydrogenase [ubiquinone] 1 beta subcomplex subunit 10 [Hypsibius exemplaris]|uniref:NADH dehydrogenase [ubiquinone] 1 beta subcomplex subunit 10 n=1 Tax=Hypsibius exemplaris TaxID=2072580 RepID=A0A1W0X9X3_HYPEX|nr:putative NADH dehydrogenase [ubiquinone] 1 beta subcomplex subunit 10 [Hypsibius exemplaris]